MIDALAAAVFLFPVEETPAPTPTPTPVAEEEVKKAPPLQDVYKGKAKIRPGMQGRSV